MIIKYVNNDYNNHILTINANIGTDNSGVVVECWWSGGGGGGGGDGSCGVVELWSGVVVEWWNGEMVEWW